MNPHFYRHGIKFLLAAIGGYRHRWCLNPEANVCKSRWTSCCIDTLPHTWSAAAWPRWPRRHTRWSRAAATATAADALRTTRAAIVAAAAPVPLIWPPGHPPLTGDVRAMADKWIPGDWETHGLFIIYTHIYIYYTHIYITYMLSSCIHIFYLTRHMCITFYV